MPGLRLVIAVESERVGAALLAVRSFRGQHPEASATVVVANAAAVQGLEEPGTTFLAGAEVAGERFAVLATALAPEELAATLGPLALQQVAWPAILLPADVEFRAPISPPGAAGAFVVATGEAGEAMVDTRALGVLDESGRPVLEELARRVERLELDDLLGTAAAELDALAIVRNPGWALSVRNSARRGLREDDGRWVLEDGRPVVWARLAARADSPGAEPLVAAATARLAAEQELTRRLPRLEVEGSALPDGTRLDARLRRLFAAGLRSGSLTAAPCDDEAFAAFRAYLDGPADNSGAGGVSRYLFDVWAERDDLQDLYPDLHDAGDRRGFLGWCVVFGAEELPIPGWLLPDEQLMVPELLERPSALGVNVAGYFQSELGVGEAARRLVTALDAAHVPLLPVQSQALPPTRRRHPYAVASPGTAPFPVNVVCVNADGLPGFAREVGPEFFRGRYTVGSWWWELPTFADQFAGAFAHVNELWVGTRFVQDAIAPAAPVPVLRMPVAVERPVVSPRTRGELGLPEGFLVLFVFDYNSVLARKNPLGLIEAFTRAFPPGSGASLVIKMTNGHLHPRDRLELELASRRHGDVHLLEQNLGAAARDELLAACDLYASLHRSEGFGLTLAEAMALERPVLATGWSGNLDFMHPETTWLVPSELVAVGDGQAPYEADSFWAEPDLDAAAAIMCDVRDRPEEAARRARAASRRLLADHHPDVVGSALRERLEAIAPLAEDRRAVEAGGAGRGAASLAAIGRARDRADMGAETHPPPAGRGRSRARAALLRTMRPVTENQRAVDGALLDALASVIDDVRSQTEAELRTHAEFSAATLASQRRLEAEVARLRDRLATTPTIAGPSAAQRAVPVTSRPPEPVDPIPGLSPQEAARVALTASVRDTDELEHVPDAGEVRYVDGTSVQVMHNGVLVEEGGYCGRWMTELIRSLHGHHEPQEERVVHDVFERLAADTRAPVCLELGSYWGYYSLWLKRRVRDTRLIMLEPDPAYRSVGERNLELNSVTAELLEAAAGAVDGVEVQFTCDSDGVERRVTMMSVDGIVQRLVPLRLDVLLVDVQGAELDVLEGAAEALRDGRVRFLVLSTHHHRFTGDPLTHQRCLRVLQAHGAHVICEHTVQESASGDGLIAVSFDERDRDMRVEVTRVRAQDSLFGGLEENLAAAMLARDSG